ncbi:MAG: hypothetical protein AB7O62_08270 [Pirellulales bacterium]
MVWLAGCTPAATEAPGDSAPHSATPAKPTQDEPAAQPVTVPTEKSRSNSPVAPRINSAVAEEDLSGLLPVEEQEGDSAKPDAGVETESAPATKE